MNSTTKHNVQATAINETGEDPAFQNQRDTLTYRYIVS